MAGPAGAVSSSRHRPPSTATARTIVPPGPSMITWPTSPGRLVGTDPSRSLTSLACLPPGHTRLGAREPQPDRVAATAETLAKYVTHLSDRFKERLPGETSGPGEARTHDLTDYESVISPGRSTPPGLSRTPVRADRTPEAQVGASWWTDLMDSPVHCGHTWCSPTVDRAARAPRSHSPGPSRGHRHDPLRDRPPGAEPARRAHLPRAARPAHRRPTSPRFWYSSA